MNKITTKSIKKAQSSQRYFSVTSVKNFENSVVKNNTI